MAESQTIGLDAGGTLLKAVYYEKGRLHLKKYSYDTLDSFLQWIKLVVPNARISITGGKAAYIQDKLKTSDLHLVDEFTAVTEGIRYLLEPSHPLLKSGFILANIGTGTSIHYITGKETIRLTGSGVGGGTLMGLASVLTGERDFQEICRMAEIGDRSMMDLQVKDIYEPLESPIPGHYTASNFGKGLRHGEIKNEDLLAALVGMITETVVLLAAGNAQLKGVKDILYIGNTMNGSRMFKKNLKQTTEIFGFTYQELERGEYSGAIGALHSE
ncbi:type II pantothenate kinase [Peribacillus deserti]|uniref:Type II pantothenate kinase n=1 Tax=Peribacillus deserti TaxID=673318 RepID=A0ABS2QF94_9BACI|nr:type II pantothenate kinase [Peribacillus deserti]MBM7691767.1 type II pantothenate kinase [Peribacillus deserti]